MTRLLRHAAFVFLAASSVRATGAPAWLGHADLEGVQPLPAQRHAELLQQLKGAEGRYVLEDGPAGWLLHEGDLRVAGNLDLEAGLVVTGDMRIEGSYDDGHGEGHLIVLGDLELEHAFSWGVLHVGGDLVTRGVVFAVYNDYTFEVEGEVRGSGGLVVSDKSSDYRTGALAFVLDDMDSDAGVLDEQAGAALRHLQPELLTDPGHLELDAYSTLGSLSPDFDLARQWAHEGRPLLRDAPAPAALAGQAAIAIAPDSSAAALRPLIAGDALLPQLIAARGDLPSELHAALLERGDAIVQRWMAQVAPQASYAQNRLRLTEELAATLAAHPDTEAAVLAEIAAHPDPAVRLTLAARDPLPAGLRERLANDADAAVRAAFVNDQLSAETLGRRVVDSDIRVRRAAAAQSLTAGQVDALLADADAALQAALARGLRAQADHRAPRRTSAAERDERAARLLDGASALAGEDYLRRQVATDAFLALSAAQQAARFDAMLPLVDGEEVAECTHSLVVMQRIVALADAHGGVLPEKLGGNPLLPDALQGEIIARARRWTPSGADADSFEPTPDDALEALLYGDVAPQRISGGRFMEITRLVLDRGIDPADGGVQNAYFHYKGFSAEAMDAIGDELGSDEDWALTVLLQPAADRRQLSAALARWYDDEDVQDELRRLAGLDDARFWPALAKAAAADLREAAARNRHTPVELLQALAADPEQDVRDAACWNARLPSAIAAGLARAGEVCVLGNPALPIEALQAVAAEAGTAERREQAYAALALRLRRAE